MDMATTDDPLARDMKRIEFAKRLLSHRVRTRIITDLTGITRNRLATLRRRWGVPEDARRRGQSPRSLDVFLCNDAARAEAAAMASLCNAFGALDKTPYPYSFARGQRLCEAYEAYCACRPQTAMELEDVFLLADALSRGEVIQMVRCKVCRCAVVIETYKIGAATCMHCATDRELNT